MGEFVRVERDEAIATIRLDRPPMNALNAQVQDEIAAAAAEVDADPAVRAVVLYGGEKVFAAGADIKEMAEARKTLDRKSTRLNSSHANISYAVFCLKKKKKHKTSKSRTKRSDSRAI